MDIPAAGARRRVRRMPSDQLYTWVQVSGSEMSRAFSSYAQSQGADEASLAEAERGVVILVAITEELRRRRNV